MSPLTTTRLDQALSGTSNFVPPASDPAKAGSFHLTQGFTHEDTRKAVLRTPLDFRVAQPGVQRDVSGHPLMRVQPHLGQPKRAGALLGEHQQLAPVPVVLLA